VSDPVTTARTARESLSRGLNALQSDPNIPPQLLDLAAPDRAGHGRAPRDRAVERHAARAARRRRAQPHAERAQAASGAAAGVRRGDARRWRRSPPRSRASTPSPGWQRQQAQPAPRPRAACRASARSAPTRIQPRMMQPVRPPVPSAEPGATTLRRSALRFRRRKPPAQAAGYARDPFAAASASTGWRARVVAASLRRRRPSGAHTVINADLGTQSPTNFYKGLSGNDIIEHGGLFVSTYMIPPIGTSVRLKISLPGGYEFEANAVVRWSREQSDDGAAPPGFGAQFTQITPEARQLVYRYTRNREPLFHDDSWGGTRPRRGASPALPTRRSDLTAS
jgi:hypothetical protein